MRGVEVNGVDQAAGGDPVSTAYPTRQHFSWLVHPIGFDEQLSVYAWRDGEIARITRDGRVEELGTIPSAHELPPPDLWQVTHGGSIVTAVSTETGVTILTAG